MCRGVAGVEAEGDDVFVGWIDINTGVGIDTSLIGSILCFCPLIQYVAS